ncbi:hypothetical protein IMSHALPRED_000598 [Imshaugia aleurites]|uniref:Uncharacterized protein n=1 Tax=Imshaugia aleurites TaxID=172621 RepID=A0A8H3GCZ1_9LECA|nr:hypothetical protein IMSHALPRED_000598 [Imshaugia aleurites]
MRPLLTHARAHTSNAKSTSTKSSKDVKSASNGSKGGPLSPVWSPPLPSSPRNVYQTLDEYSPDLENGDSSFEMKHWPQTRQNARFGSYETHATPSADFHSILRSERLGREKDPVSSLEPQYVGPARI